MKIDQFSRKDLTSFQFNHWDIIAIFSVVLLFFNFAWFTQSLFEPVNFTAEMQHIDLNPIWLPYYTFRSFTRMMIAMVLSLAFTFSIGTLAAKNKLAEKIIIPLIDILQSVPIIGFIAASILLLITIFPQKLFALEAAIIFGIFTAQVWNITLSFYQSIKTLPKHYQETSMVFHLSRWKRFWIIEVPHSLPGLLSNIMVSMSQSWFYVVVSEAIHVSQVQIFLPGLGSYIEFANKNGDLKSLYYAIIAMFVMILIYDRLIFKPLQVWQAKLNEQDMPQQSSFIINFLQKTTWVKQKWPLLKRSIVDAFPEKSTKYAKNNNAKPIKHIWSQLLSWLSEITMIAIILISTFWWVTPSLYFDEVIQVLKLGLITSIRVFVTVIMSLLIWVPIGIWIGRRPAVSELFQPIIQFLAAYPPNAIYPFCAILIIDYHLDPNIWLSPLMILGAQWYILFNVITGTQMLPKDLLMAISSFNISNLSYYRKVILPGIFPYIITGAIAAAGGAWNVCIITESVSWSNQSIHADGLGYYIKLAIEEGEYEKISLGISIMCCYVLFYNRLIWQPLYRWIEGKYSM